MSTLLAYNENGALVGDWQGNVSTIPRPSHLSIEQWHEQVGHHYLDAGRPWETDKEYVPFTRSGALHPTENTRLDILETQEVPVPIKTYSDDSVALTVEAAFDPHTHIWVVVKRP